MQTRFVNAAEFEVLGGGAKGPGKSDCLLFAATRQIDKAAYKALITRETGPQLLELIDRSHRSFPRMATKPAWRGDLRRWTWPSGATLKFEAIGTPADVERIQGQEWAYVAQDEVGNVVEERTVDLVQAEIRCPDPTVRRFWRGSANPGKPGHAWIKRRFVNPCGADGRRIVMRRIKLMNGETAELTRRYVPGTVLDNPIYATDALYMAQLATLPEVLRQQLLYGDWSAGYGMALSELNEGVHFCRAFEVPGHWTRWGSFDYGFAHNWVWIYFAADEDGTVYVLDTVRGRRHLPHQIAERVKSRGDTQHPQYLFTHSDSYAFQSKKELSESTPTIADILSTEHNLILSQGNTDRKAGLQNLRYYVAWRGINSDGSNGRPGVYFLDTPGNQWLFEQLQAMVTDESDMEDVLKVDSDPETGHGGDDGYDAFRVGMACRPPRAIGLYYDEPVSAFSHAALIRSVELLYKDTPGFEPRGTAGGYYGTLYQGV